MKRSLIAAIVAVCLALIGIAAVLLYVQGADARAVAGRQAVQVLIATKRIPAGTTGARIRSGGYVEQVTMPKSTVPGDAMSVVDPNLDKLAVTADVQPRQLVLRGAFDIPSTLTGGLNVPEGKMAVSVQMAAPEQVAGYVRPGSKIAVFDTFNGADKSHIPSGERLTFANGVNQVTRVLLPRVEVVGVGNMGTNQAATTTTGETEPGKTDSKNASQNNTNALLVTVAVTQDEAERLVHAVQTGTLYLALLDDTTEVRPGNGVDNKTLFP